MSVIVLAASKLPKSVIDEKNLAAPNVSDKDMGSELPTRLSPGQQLSPTLR
jgi:hypothetical protein